MFAGFDFGEGYFADAPIVVAPPPTPGQLVPTLLLECRTKVCSGEGGLDFDYRLDTATVPAAVAECRRKDCEESQAPDLTTYSLQDALFFNGTPLTFVVPCPEGYDCAPGTFPMIITYPPGEFTIPAPTPYPTPGGFPTILTMQSCQGPMTQVVPFGASQAELAAAAQDLIYRVASAQAVCDSIPFLPPANPVAASLSAITTVTCSGGNYFQTIAVSSTPSGAPYTMNLAPRPAWMSVASNVAGTQLLLTGTPTTAQIGTYNFTVTAFGTAADGRAVSGARAYTVTVVGIATASPLPAGTVGVAYSQALDASSMSGVLTWSVTGGALPAGLSLNTSTGTIFGTPTTEEVAAFTIQVTNGVTTCSKAFGLTVEEASACPDFTAIVWGAPSTNNINNGSTSSSAAGDTLTMGSDSGVFSGLVDQGSISIGGTVNYTGPGGLCCLQLTIGGTAIDAFDNTFNLDILQDGGGILSLAGDPSGQYSFTVAASAGVSVIDIGVILVSQANGGSPAQKNLTLTAVFGNCP